MKIVVPLAGPGILAGVMITLIPALGAYLTPDLMGGTVQCGFLATPTVA